MVLLKLDQFLTHHIKVFMVAIIYLAFLFHKCCETPENALNYEQHVCDNYVNFITVYEMFKFVLTLQW